MSVTLASGFVSMKEVKVEAGVVEVASQLIVHVQSIAYDDNDGWISDMQPYVFYCYYYKVTPSAPGWYKWETQT